MQVNIISGDFSHLADAYSRYRPSYSSTVLKQLLDRLDGGVEQASFADVGAGTGIWTRLVAASGVRSAIAVEPCDEMRIAGAADSAGLPIEWRKGSAERTGLDTASCDLLTMASSLHWADLDLAFPEFHRVLREGGQFAALWNPRIIEGNPLLTEIENHLYELAPHIKRKSSGLSGMAATLGETLQECRYFDSVEYFDDVTSIDISPENYIGAWWSVNDIRAQAGEAAFAEFMRFVVSRVEPLPAVSVSYRTVCWSAIKAG